MPLTIAQLERAIQRAEGCVRELEPHSERPKLVRISGKPFFRHAQKNDLLMSHLKCVRAISSLNASLELLKRGYVQEIGALCRCIDECCEGIMFLATPLGEDGDPAGISNGWSRSSSRKSSMT